jgi:hypothetical protein
VAWNKKIETVKLGSDYRSIRPSQFKLVTSLQATNHLKWHGWGNVKRSVRKLECVFNNDEKAHGETDFIALLAQSGDCVNYTPSRPSGGQLTS